jgi:hypothetical protein
MRSEVGACFETVLKACGSTEIPASIEDLCPVVTKEVLRFVDKNATATNHPLGAQTVGCWGTCTDCPMM